MYGEIDKVLEHRLVKGMIGNMRLDVKASSAKVSVVTGANELWVRVFTRATSGPAVEAVQESVIELQGDTLKIFVPAKNSYRSFTSYSGVQFNTFTSGVVNQMVGGGTLDGVEVHVNIPAAHINADIASGSLVVVGSVDTLVADIRSGSLKADKTHHLNIQAPSAAAEIGHVTGHAKASAPSGTLRIGEYSGNHLEATASSGTIRIHVGPAATGEMKLKASSGTIKVTGADANRKVRVSAKATSGTAMIM